MQSILFMWSDYFKQNILLYGQGTSQLYFCEHYIHAGYTKVS
jgi:hypothetical protein